MSISAAEFLKWCEVFNVDFNGGTSGDVNAIIGTANQVIVSNPTGNVTLSLPQSIGTGNTPTFAGANLGNISISGNTVSSTNTNGFINFQANGTGQYIFGLSGGVAPEVSSNGIFSVGVPGTIQGAVRIYAYLNSAGSGNVTLGKSRSTAIGSFSVVQAGDSLGGIFFKADTGAALGIRSYMQSSVTTVGAFVGSNYSIATSSPSTSGAIVALTIDDGQIVTLAHPLPTGSGGTGTTSSTGTGSLVLQNTPTLITPVLGAATATSIYATGNLQAKTYLIAGDASGGVGGNGVILYANTTAKGFLLIEGVDNIGNFGVSIKNASFGQASTLTIPDVAAVNANFIMSGNVAGIQSVNTNLNISTGADTVFNIVSTSATGQPYIQWTRNTSTAINYIQAGTNVAGNASSTGTLFVNNIAGGDFFFNVVGTGNLLTLGITAATFSKQVIAPSFSPSTTSGIIGTTTNNDAASGSVGEYVTSNIPVASAITLSSGAGTNITTISLTAGDWDVFGNISFGGDTNTVVGFTLAGSSIVSQTFPDASQYASSGFGSPGILAFANSTRIGLPIPTTRLSLSGTTTVYLVADMLFSVGAGTACGTLSARRRR